LRVEKTLISTTIINYTVSERPSPAPNATIEFAKPHSLPIEPTRMARSIYLCKRAGDAKTGLALRGCVVSKADMPQRRQRLSFVPPYHLAVVSPAGDAVQFYMEGTFIWTSHWR
jgi:hypothetical protein